jgi:hypothetical protein
MSLRQRALGPANWLVLRLDGSIRRVTKPVDNARRL